MEEQELDPPSPTPEPELEPEPPPPAAPQTVSIEEWIASTENVVVEAPQPESMEDSRLLAVLEACVYVTEEPLMPAQIAAALNQEPERIKRLLNQLVAEFERPEHGVSIKEVAGGYKMATKAEHHDAVRNFVKSLKAPLKLSLPALETLAVIAYKQPVTTPEIMEIRGVQGGSVLRTLLDRKLITEAGRKSVIGKPILYKTTKEFLIQFGLKDLAELPSLKEFEELRRMAMSDGETPAAAAALAEEAASETTVADATASEMAVAETALAEPVDGSEPVLEAEATVVETEAAPTESSEAAPTAESVAFEVAASETTVADATAAETAVAGAAQPEPVDDAPVPEEEAAPAIETEVAPTESNEVAPPAEPAASGEEHPDAPPPAESQE
jgi:segregation and condensation protein B